VFLLSLLLALSRTSQLKTYIFRFQMLSGLDRQMAETVQFLSLLLADFGSRF
jgi:hypothetical protein